MFVARRRKFYVFFVIFFMFYGKRFMFNDNFMGFKVGDKLRKQKRENGEISTKWKHFNAQLKMKKKLKINNNQQIQ